MADSRIKNAKRNILWAIVNRIVSLLLPFLTRTAIIYYLGALYLGLNGLFGTILTMLSLAELGFGSAMVFSMYEPLAKNRDQEVCALLNLYRKIYRIIGLVILTLGLIVMAFLPNLIKGEHPSDVNLYVLYGIFLLGTVISYFLYAYKESLLIANQRSDITSNVHTIVQISSAIIQLVVLFFSHNYYAFCIVIPLTSIARNLLINFWVNRFYPQYTCFGEVSKETFQDIKKRVGGLVIYKICYVLRDSIANIFVSAFLGLAVLGVFTNYIYIVSAITGFFTVVKNSISAGVGNSMVLDSEEKNYQDFKKFQLLYMGLAAWTAIFLLCLIQPFMHLWLGSDYMFPDYTMVFFFLYYYCYKMGDMCAVYRQAAGLWWQDRFRPIVEALANVLLCSWLTSRLGIVGVLLSTIICLIFINSFWASRVLFKYYFIHHRQIEYIKRIAFFFAVTLLCGAITYYFCSFFASNTIMGVLIRFSICAIVPPLFIIPCLSVLSEYSSSKEFFIKSVIRR